MAVQQRLAQGLVLWDGLQGGAVAGDVADRPLPQPRAGEAEHVARENIRFFKPQI